MATVNNVYDNLYNNLKNKFTVEDKNCEYTLGGYMLMKANENRKSGTNLPVASLRHENRAVAAVVNYINDKLTVKKPPEKDKTLKAFPFRSSVAAFLSAVLVCTVVFTYGLISVKGTEKSGAPMIADASEETAEEISAENTNEF